MSVTDEPLTASPPSGRPRNRGPWYALAALTAALVVVPAGLEVVGVQMRHGSDVSETLTRHVRAVEVEAASASVTVRASSGPSRIRRDLHWVLTRPRVTTDWDGDTLKLKVTCGDGGVIGWSLCDANVTVDVPADVAVSGRMSSGTLAVSGLTGKVEVRNNSGTLDLSDLAGPLRAKVASGSINGRRLRSDDVNVSSGSGSVKLGFTAPASRVVARTGSGSIDLGFPAGSHYLVTGHSGSGSRNFEDGIEGGPGTADTLDVTTGSGAVDVHYT
ncbi:DUF4097 family beta strand repeat-containing protein [Actinomadura rupiterrae]|uniref:DUF4097 family beta strand repeat-containing protein n=1 Tax=Actinomadura rupiterrae TaxID=559627 RepID=UPI0020A3523F|nr:DUF4097 family beta strand repeat-containing protein [Actinomadura rupiterrae]MCP2335673.1 hypothetical protein [Actinomadura rupiterrae]